MNSNSPARPELPHNVEAEQQVLGALLGNNDLYERIVGRLKAEAFYDPVHRDIFEQLVSRIDGGMVASPVALKPAFETHEGLKALGGTSYLARLAGSALSTFAIKDYAEIIVDLHAKRVLIEDMREARLSIAEGRKGAVEIASSLETGAGKILATSSLKPLVRSHLSSLMGAIRQVNDAYSGVAQPGISSGLPQLDNKLGFLRPGQMIVLAGRPAMGKTTVAQNIAFAAAKAGIGVFYASLEMPGEELAVRFIAKGLAEKGVNIPYNRMIRGQVSEAEMRQIVEEGKAQQSLPLRIGERDVRNISRLRAAAKRAKQELADGACPLGLVIIDYLQLIEGDRSQRTYDKVSEASDACKSLAMSLNVPVIPLSQLSREVERRDPPIPMLADLRESGKLEEDSDVVLFCYREAYYLQRKLEACNGGDLDTENDLRLAMSRIENNLDIIVGKQRSGSTGTVTSFVDLATCHISADRFGQAEQLI